MPVARIEINGRIARVEVPAGTTPEQARQIALQAVNAPAKAPAQKPTSFWQGVLQEGGKAVSNAQWVLDTITGKNIVRDLTGQPSPADLQRAQLAQQQARSRYQGSTAGKITGTILGSAPTWFLPGGPLAQGAAAGFLTTQNPNNLRGTAKDMAFGAVTGKVGDKMVGGLSRVISPRVAPVVQRLKDRGIPLTIGQIAGANGGTIGRTVRGIENKLTSVPGVGDAISKSYQRGQTALNQAAFKEGLAPIGKQVGDIGEAGIEQAKQAVAQGYDEALGAARIVPDPQMASDLNSVAQVGQAPGNFTEDFNRIMRDEVGPLMTPESGAMTGREIQELLRISSGYGRQYGKLGTTGANGIPQPSAKPVAEAFAGLNKAAESMVSRQAPDVMPAYRAANEAYRNLGVIRDAVNAAKVGGGGEFTAAQLSQAARANAKKFGGTHGTTDQPFFELTRDAQDVMPSTIPNSGSADRGLVGLLLGGSVGMPAVAASGLASMPYTKAGQKVIERLLTGRQSPGFKTLAQALEELRPLGVAGGAATGSLLFGP